jgi:aspartate racemase
MKKVGIVGGLGPESTIMYYKEIIAGYQKFVKTGDYPLIVIDSVNMTKLLGYLENKQKEDLVSYIVNSLKHLAAAGADFAAISSNTPHIVFEKVKEQSPLPLISIIEETCRFSKNNGYKKVVVLGTKFTMSSRMYRDSFEKYNMKAFTPDEASQTTINNIIYPNLENGIILPEDKLRMINIAEKEISNIHADALVLGCTELPLMIKQEDITTPLINTTQIHIDAIIQELLQ